MEICDDGRPTTPEEENDEVEPEITFEEDVKMPKRPPTAGFKETGLTEFHITKGMVHKYNYTKGCPACEDLRRRSQEGQPLTGRIGVYHSETKMHG